MGPAGSCETDRPRSRSPHPGTATPREAGEGGARIQLQTARSRPEWHCGLGVQRWGMGGARQRLPQPINALHCQAGAGHRSPLGEKALFSVPATDGAGGWWVLERGRLVIRAGWEPASSTPPSPSLSPAGLRGGGGGLRGPRGCPWGSPATRPIPNSSGCWASPEAPEGSARTHTPDPPATGQYPCERAPALQPPAPTPPSGDPRGKTAGEPTWTGHILANEAGLRRASKGKHANKSGVGSADKGWPGSRCACGRGRGRQLLPAGRGGPPTRAGGAGAKEAPPRGKAAADRAHCLPCSWPGRADTAAKACRPAPRLPRTVSAPATGGAAPGDGTVEAGVLCGVWGPRYDRGWAGSLSQEEAPSPAQRLGLEASADVWASPEATLPATPTLGCSSSGPPAAGTLLSPLHLRAPLLRPGHTLELCGDAPPGAPSAHATQTSLRGQEGP